jgi:hypothetical protein
LRRMISISATVQGLPCLTSEALSNLSAPELFETSRTFDNLAGTVAFFVEVEVAMGAIEVCPDETKAMFKVLTIGTHTKARLLAMTKRTSSRRCRPRQVFLNGAG